MEDNSLKALPGNCNSLRGEIHQLWANFRADQTKSKLKDGILSHREGVSSLKHLMCPSALKFVAGFI